MRYRTSVSLSLFMHRQLGNSLPLFVFILLRDCILTDCNVLFVCYRHCIKTMATLTSPFISHSFRSSKQFSRILHRSSIQSVLSYRLSEATNLKTSQRKMSSATAEKKCLHISNINPYIKTMEYAVR